MAETGARGAAERYAALLEDYVVRAEAVFRGIRWRGFGDVTVTRWCESMEEQARELLDGVERSEAVAEGGATRGHT